MDFASIWVILKAESCWVALILYRIVEVHVRGEPEPVSLSVRRYIFFVSFLSLALQQYFLLGLWEEI